MPPWSNCVFGCRTARRGPSDDGDHVSNHSELALQIISTRATHASSQIQHSPGGEGSDDSDDSDDPEVLRARHARSKVRGSQLRQWMQDPHAPGCVVAQVTINWQTLSDEYDLEFSAVRTRYVKYNDIMDRQILGLDTNLDFLDGAWGCNDFVWDGYTAPGIIIMEGVTRIRNSTAPHISEISHAIYTKDHSINSLKQVYVMLVENRETLPFVMRHMYSEANDLTWRYSGEKTWVLLRMES